MTEYLSICKCTKYTNNSYDFKSLNMLGLYFSVMLSGKGM